MHSSFTVLHLSILYLSYCDKYSVTLSSHKAMPLTDKLSNVFIVVAMAKY